MKARREAFICANGVAEGVHQNGSRSADRAGT
jgi:hypothetical protein